MARTDDLTNFLVDVAAAIKAKKGSQTDIPAANFDTEIASIDTVNNQNKTITPTTSQQTVTADQGYTGIGTATVSAVTASIDQNIVAGNIKKDVTILGVTGTFEGAEDLTSVLNAQDQKIAELETALENKTAGAVKPNIYVQLDEPTTKKGIWLQTNETPEHYVADDDVVESESWYPDGTYRNIPYSFYNGSTAAVVGTDVYLFGTGGAYNTSGAKSCCKYDTLANTYTQLTNIPYGFTNGSVVAIGTDIYLFGGDGYATTAYKYNTLTDTYTQLTNIPYGFWKGSATIVGTDIYLLGGNNSATTAYKYNTLTNTYTQLTNIPYSFYRGVAIAIGTDIYLFGSANSSSDYKKAYKYNTLTNTYTQLTNVPTNAFDTSAIAMGTSVYIFGGGDLNLAKNCYEYNTLTNTYTKLTDIPYEFSKGSATLVNDKAYLFGGSNYNSKVQCMQVISKTFENNSVVISQGRLYNVGYATELFSCSDFTSPALYAFADAWFYTTQDGLITNIPTYYGNGTQWINIKNPIVEEVEE